MKVFELSHAIWLPRPVGEVFRFFADASNLGILTPEWLRFRIMSDTPIVMGVGTEISYQIRLRGVPLRWSSRITRWEPPRVFVDEQVRGPYRQWIHTHLFVAVEGGTRVTDHVRYAVWGGRLVNRWIVEPDLARIFRFRAEKLLERFGAAREMSTDQTGTQS